jgi:hypothetical protein
MACHTTLNTYFTVAHSNGKHTGKLMNKTRRMIPQHDRGQVPPEVTYFTADIERTHPV